MIGGGAPRARCLLITALLLCCAPATSQERRAGKASADAQPEGIWSDRDISPSAYAHYIEARIHYDSGRIEDALAHLNLALAFDEPSPYLRLWRAQVLLERGELDKARGDLDKARAVAPRSGAVALMEGRLLAREGDLGGAARAARLARMRAPGLEEAWIAEATWRQELGQLDEARRLWAALSKKHPGDLSAALALGELCDQLQDQRCAVEALERVVALRPEREASWLRLGAAWERGHGFSAAYESYLRCTLALSPAPQCWLRRVQMREQLAAVAGPAREREARRQQLLDEVAEMADALAGVPGAPHAIAARLATLEDPLLLEHFIGRCRWRREGLADLSFHLGNLYERQGNLGQAARHFGRVPRESPWLVESRTRLAVLLQQQGRHAQALRALEEALEEAPGLRELYLLKAALLDQAGQPRKATEALERGARALPQDAELWAQLGDRHRDAGRARQAAQAYQRALEGATDPELRQRLRALLGQDNGDP